MKLKLQKFEYPMGSNGDSALLATKYTEYAFFADPSYLGTPQQQNARSLQRNIRGTEPTQTNNGMLYYKGALNCTLYKANR